MQPSNNAKNASFQSLRSIERPQVSSPIGRLRATRKLDHNSPRWNVSRVGGGAFARWPPSASQTARAVFPHAAFTKTQDFRDAKVGMKRDPLGTRQVDPIHQSPRTRAYGFFAKGTVPTSLILTHLVSFLLLTIFAGCLPRPTSVAGCPFTWLSPRFIGSIQPSDY